MDIVEIEVNTRTLAGKNSLRKLRGRGKIPAVVYAEGSEAAALEIDALHFARKTAGRGASQLYTLKGMGGEASDELTLIKDMQIEPLKDLVLHIDFYRVTAGTKIGVTVPLRLTGECPAVKLVGAIVNQMIYEVEVECLPRAIPNEFLLDVTELVEGQSLHLSDLELPEGVVLKTDPSIAAVSALVKKAVEEEEVVAEAEGEAVAEGEKPAEGAASTEKKEEKPG